MKTLHSSTELFKSLPVRSTSTEIVASTHSFVQDRMNMGKPFALSLLVSQPDTRLTHRGTLHIHILVDSLKPP